MELMDDKNHFMLEVRGYEFLFSQQNKDGNEYDLNWLKIRIHSQTSLGAWTSENPIMLTWEVECLSKWFDDILNEINTVTELDFIEPNLSFKLISKDEENFLFRVFFVQEYFPKEVFISLDENKGFIDISVNRNQLKIAIKDLDDYLMKYPKRNVSAIFRNSI